MPLYMDIHVVPGATPAALEEAHNADLAVQDKHCVHCLKYWLNEEAGKVFCLFDAPNPEAAAAVHREAHGLMAEKIIEVDLDMADGLLGPGEINHAGAVLLADHDEKHDTGVRAIMFTDIVGSTEMTSRYGDDAAIAMLEVHDHIVRTVVGGNSGREVKHTGDGIMASFLSAGGAIDAMMQVQRQVAEHNARMPNQSLHLRIGLNAGEPIQEEDDLFGSTVQLAARVCAATGTDEIYCTAPVMELSGKPNSMFKSVGAKAVKGFREPITMYEIVWR